MNPEFEDASMHIQNTEQDLEVSKEQAKVLEELTKCMGGEEVVSHHTQSFSNMVFQQTTEIQEPQLKPRTIQPGTTLLLDSEPGTGKKEWARKLALTANKILWLTPSQESANYLKEQVKGTVVDVGSFHNWFLETHTNTFNDIMKLTKTSDHANHYIFTPETYELVILDELCVLYREWFSERGPGKHPIFELACLRSCIHEKTMLVGYNCFMSEQLYTCYHFMQRLRSPKTTEEVRSFAPKVLINNTDLPPFQAKIVSNESQWESQLKRCSKQPSLILWYHSNPSLHPPSFHRKGIQHPPIVIPANRAGSLLSVRKKVFESIFVYICGSKENQTNNVENEPLWKEVYRDLQRLKDANVQTYIYLKHDK